jgi:hypothetical protein
MCLRISSAGLGGVLALAACGPDAEAVPGMAVECALGSGATFAPTCSMERELEGGRFVVHHPGGSFRRLRFDPEAREVTAADGADPVAAQMADQDYLNFTMAQDRYRIPLAELTDVP